MYVSQDMAPVEMLDKLLEDQQCRLLQTQELSSSMAGSQLARIHAMEREIAVLKKQKDELRRELQEKSREWKNIKSRLLGRTSIRQILAQDPLQPGEARDGGVQKMAVDLSEERQIRSDVYGLVSTTIEEKNLYELENRCHVEAAISSPGTHQDCPCCTKFYRAIHTGRSPTKKTPNKPESKHIIRAQMPGTPPGFWDIGFTQNND